ncbi:MAG TPA: hypothetical protein DCE41_10435 [Cytophagales bacterium]|nr:hypothetical protein [Cytophagales bacterium]HAA19321.1 hypothetical protein [Cytophagales bacterium]HAP61291.1 hypothetical protein [Cytophagales bacterium]
MALYVNPYTDFGFKRIFFNPAHQRLLLNFLNAILAFLGDPLLVELEYLSPDQQPETRQGRRVSFDVLVKDETGRHYLIEMQQGSQAHFFKRLTYYLCRMVINQGEKGNVSTETDRPKPYDYNWRPVFAIALMDFLLPMEGLPKELAIHPFRIGHMLAPKIQFPDLTWLCLEMPKFGKTLEEAETRLEEWLFFIKNLEIKPDQVEDSDFKELLEVANLANLTPEEYENYMLTRKQYDDYYNSLDYAEKRGEQRGEQRGEARGRKDEKSRIFRVIEALKAGQTPEAIANSLSIPLSEVLEIQSLLG